MNPVHNSQLALPREMEYIERTSFVEIYGLNIAQPISLLTNFRFFKSTQHPNTLHVPMVLVVFFIWVKSVLRCALYIFHLSGSLPQIMNLKTDCNFHHHQLCRKKHIGGNGSNGIFQPISTVPHEQCDQIGWFF